jgi:hypothetical protein
LRYIQRRIVRILYGDYAPGIPENGLYTSGVIQVAHIGILGVEIDHKSLVCFSNDENMTIAIVISDPEKNRIRSWKNGIVIQEIQEREYIGNTQSAYPKWPLENEAEHINNLVLHDALFPHQDPHDGRGVVIDNLEKFHRIDHTVTGLREKSRNLVDVLVRDGEKGKLPILRLRSLLSNSILKFSISQTSHF